MIPNLVREVIRGKLTLRMVSVQGGFSGIILGENAGRATVIKGTDAEDVWGRLEDEAGKTNRGYFGFDGARGRFLSFFPGGFSSPDFAAREREYKLKAKKRLDAVAPLSAAVSGSGYGEAILSVFRATDLLHPIEKTRLQALLRGRISR